MNTGGLLIKTWNHKIIHPCLYLMFQTYSTDSFLLSYFKTGKYQIFSSFQMGSKHIFFIWKQYAGSWRSFSHVSLYLHSLSMHVYLWSSDCYCFFQMYIIFLLSIFWIMLYGHGHNRSIDFIVLSVRIPAFLILLHLKSIK